MFVRHSLIYLLARGIPSIVAFLAIAIYTRLLTPEEFGLYTLVYTGALLLSSVCFQWLRLGLLRFYQERDSSQKTVLISTIAMAFLAVAGALLLMLPIAYFLKDFSWVVLGLAIGIVQGAFDILLERARVELAPWRFGFVAFMRAILMLGGGLVGFELGGVQGLLIGVFVGVLLVVGVELRQVSAGMHLACARKHELWSLLRFGGPLSATFVLAGIMGFADRYMLAWLQDTAAAGHYAAAYDLTQKVIVTLMMVVNLSGYPLLLKAQAEGNAAVFQQRIRQTLSGLLLIGLPVTLMFVTMPGLIASVLLGAAFQREAVTILPWLALAALFEGMTVYYFYLSFQLRQHTWHQVWIVGAAAGLNILLNLWWIPIHGVLGAAWATIAANLLAIGLSFMISRRELRLPMMTRDAFAVVISALVMGSWVVWAMSWVKGMSLSPLPSLLLLAIPASALYMILLLGFDVLGVRSALIELIFKRHAETENPFR
ncbi:lipopolysaccharide biosynthesis protein [Thioalkalivibrio sulfidiphilus]|uniref:lipopolysaccharide biosynthesis protein n=1 Tax=Thioalkalivibrio sulfidiphilus TaxID=1033854 RepID=UPI003B2BC362